MTLGSSLPPRDGEQFRHRNGHDKRARDSHAKPERQCTSGKGL